MAASGAEYCTGEGGANTVSSAAQLRLRAEARQRRLLLSRASRRLQVIGGCPGDGEGGQSSGSQRDTAHKGQERRPVSPLKRSHNEVDTISGQHETVSAEAPTGALVAQPSHHAESDPCVVSLGSHLRREPSGSPTTVFGTQGVIVRRLHGEPAHVVELGTFLRGESKVNVSSADADSKRTAVQPVWRCTIPAESIPSYTTYRKFFFTVSGYLALRLLTFSYTQVKMSFDAVLNALHANLRVLRRLHVFAFTLVATISALLPHATIPEGPVSVSSPAHGYAKLPATIERQLCCLVRYVIIFVASRPIFCILCGTCGLLCVEHAPNMLQWGSRGRDNNGKAQNSQESPAPQFLEMQQSKGEFGQQQGKAGSSGKSLSRTVSSTNSPRSIHVEGPQPGGRRSRVDLLQTLLSNVIFLVQCCATFLHVLQLLATFIVLHCIIRVGVVQMGTIWRKWHRMLFADYL